MKTIIKKWLGIDQPREIGDPDLNSTKIRNALSEIPSYNKLKDRIDILEFKLEYPSQYKIGDIVDKVNVITGIEVKACSSDKLRLIYIREKARGTYWNCGEVCYCYSFTNIKTGKTGTLYFCPRFNEFI